jgi:hypothetical protein
VDEIVQGALAFWEKRTWFERILIVAPIVFAIAGMTGLE